MPQKTRRQKEAASQRRFNYTLSERSHEVKPHVHVEKTTPVHAVDEEDIAVKKYFITDLKRSAIFIVLVFALEFLLRFARIDTVFFR